jgi:hypothetical protein
VRIKRVTIETENGILYTIEGANVHTVVFDQPKESNKTYLHLTLVAVGIPRDQCEVVDSNSPSLPAMGLITERG